MQEKFEKMKTIYRQNIWKKFKEEKKNLKEKKKKSILNHKI